MAVITKEHLDAFDKKYFPECYEIRKDDYTEIKWRHPDYVIKP